jgi:hypothetical protein
MKTKICCTLIDYGSANVYALVAVDETGRPAMKESLPFRGTGEEKDEMLKVLCSRLPVAISTDFLF